MRDTEVPGGRLGDIQLQPGYSVSIGRALGLGGVRARLAHHMRPPNIQVSFFGRITFTYLKYATVIIHLDLQRVKY